MDFKIKESLLIQHGNTEYVVRPGTTGIEKNRIVFFHDNTRAFAVGFPRDFCLENPQIFQLSRTLADRDISVRDVLRVIEESGLSKQETEELCDRIKNL